MGGCQSTEAKEAAGAPSAPMPEAEGVAGRAEGPGGGGQRRRMAASA